MQTQNKTLTDITVTPSIYVACLAAYNNGHLHGKWIDATQTKEEINKQILDILKSSPIEDAEEWAIHDYEGFEGVSLSEYSGIDKVVKYADFIDEHGKLGGAVLANFNADIDEATKAFENYAGEYTSLADVAEELTDAIIEVPQCLASYIDYESMAKDMEMNGDFFSVQFRYDQNHIFWSH